MRIRKPAIERFMNMVSPEPNTGCWLWTGHLGLGDYGTFSDENGKNKQAHRWAYEHFVGMIEPPSLSIDHLCGTTCCVNPMHLEPVPIATNIRRGKSAN